MYDQRNYTNLRQILSKSTKTRPSRSLNTLFKIGKLNILTDFVNSFLKHSRIDMFRYVALKQYIQHMNAYSHILDYNIFGKRFFVTKAFLRRNTNPIIVSNLRFVTSDIHLKVSYTLIKILVKKPLINFVLSIARLQQRLKKKKLLNTIKAINQHINIRNGNSVATDKNFAMRNQRFLRFQFFSKYDFPIAVDSAFKRVEDKVLSKLFNVCLCLRRLGMSRGQHLSFLPQLSIGILWMVCGLLFF